MRIVSIALLCSLLFLTFIRAQGTTLVQGASAIAPAGAQGSLVPVMVTVTWPVQFASSAVSVVCGVEDPTGGNLGGSLFVRNIRDVTASSVKVPVWTLTGSTAHAGIVHCLGSHP
jgi:hypothetical protein